MGQVAGGVLFLLCLPLLISYLLFLIEGVIIAWILLMMTGLLLLGPAVRFVQRSRGLDRICDRQVGGGGGCAVTVYLYRFP